MIDVSWFAGVLDARAHMRLENRRGVAQPRLRITTRKVVLLDILAEMTATKARTDDAPYEKRPCSEHCGTKHVHVARQSAYWNADGIRATIILHSCLPYLRSSRPEALSLLKLGYDQYRPTKNGIAPKMKSLGWTLPDL